LSVAAPCRRVRRSTRTCVQSDISLSFFLVS
jgi:hypothetical protein